MKAINTSEALQTGVLLTERELEVIKKALDDLEYHYIGKSETWAVKGETKRDFYEESALEVIRILVRKIYPAQNRIKKAVEILNGECDENDTQE